MPEVTSNSQVNVVISKRAKDGTVKSATLRPGETKNVDFDVDDVHVQPLLRTGAISVEGRGSKQAGRVAVADNTVRKAADT
ncbi:hypothetical protein [Microvirga massiliensis]|uniref:hypothetical protein n=1 Tax=Microvirga massiliensis TaxID=1033741 RepID=UPI00062BE437|nr:hypothetical protein [Microvirga massiliensis]